MKKYNRFYYVFIILGVFLLSCEGILNETVRSDVSFAHYDTQEGIESGVAAAYDKVREPWNFYNELNVSLKLLGTDTYMHARDTGGKNELDRYVNLNSSFSPLYNALWAPYYDGINRVNTVIGAIEEIGDGMPENLKTLRTAELSFLRGLYYFELVQHFGEIPLVTSAELGVRTEFSHSPVAEVYEQIISDLNFATDNLPLNQNDYGRATKGAAQHLLAQVYLTRGSAVTDERGQQPSDMQNAADLADEVIFSGVYELVEDFSDLWGLDNQRNSEVIFAALFSQNNLYNNDAGNGTHLYFGSTYDLKPGMKRTLEYGRPWNRHQPTIFTIRELYDNLHDSRFHKTFQSVWYANNPNNIAPWEPAGGFEPPSELLGEPKIAVGDTSIWITNEIYPEDTNFDSLYASKSYHYMPINRQGLADFFVNLKHLDPERNGTNDVHGSLDGIWSRLAETYLIAAEAYGRMGDFATAADRLNPVRERAAYKEGELKDVAYWKVHGGSYSNRFQSTIENMRITAQDLQSEPSFVDFMLDERARELNGEFKRWEDLVRTEKLIERAREHNPFAVQNIQDYHKLRPIPQNHIDRLDPQPPIEEVQNEGYY